MPRRSESWASRSIRIVPSPSRQPVRDLDRDFRAAAAQTDRESVTHHRSCLVERHDAQAVRPGGRDPVCHARHVHAAGEEAQAASLQAEPGEEGADRRLIPRVGLPDDHRLPVREAAP